MASTQSRLNPKLLLVVGRSETNGVRRKIKNHVDLREKMLKQKNLITAETRFFVTFTSECVCAQTEMEHTLRIYIFLLSITFISWCTYDVIVCIVLNH